jgi:hypothetical protein
VQFLIFGQEHDAHPAATERAHNAIATDQSSGVPRTIHSRACHRTADGCMKSELRAQVIGQGWVPAGKLV